MRNTAATVLVFLQIVWAIVESGQNAQHESVSLFFNEWLNFKSCGLPPLKFTTQIPHQIQSHYIFLLNKTEKFRQSPIQLSGNENQEPYIEKRFIDTFSRNNLTYFGGMVPLFVQWTDYQQLHKNESVKHDEHIMFREILKYMRPDVLYVTVAQANKGLSLFRNVKNVLVLSAGGVGQIPIPLSKGVIAHSPLNLMQLASYNPLGFFGSLDHGPRHSLIDELRSALKASRGSVSRLIIGKGDDWQRSM